MPYSIAIVGCGVSGLTAALLLARSGNQITLFEQSPQVGPAGAGILLQPSGQLVLQQMGLLELVTARAAKIDRLRARTHRDRKLIDLPYAAAGTGLHAFGLHRGDLFSVLHAEVQSARVQIKLNCRITRFIETDRSVELFDDQNQSRGVFDLLIAADGARSTLRAATGLPASVHQYPHSALWALGTCTTVRDHLFQVTQGTKLLCGLLPTGEDRCSLFWSVDRDEEQAIQAGGFDAWQKRVRLLVPQAEELLAGLTSFDQTRLTKYAHVRMKRWHTHRCLLIGDAAHAMSPHLGQGINLGLLDGLTIAHALATASSPEVAFARYSQGRRTHTNFYARVTFLLSPFFQSESVVKGWLRDLFLPHLDRVPVFGPQMLLTMTGLKRSIFGGTIHLPTQSS